MIIWSQIRLKPEIREAARFVSAVDMGAFAYRPPVLLPACMHLIRSLNGRRGGKEQPKREALPAEERFAPLRERERHAPRF